MRCRAIALGETDGFLNETFPGVNDRLLSRELNQFSRSFHEETAGQTTRQPSHETPVSSRSNEQGHGQVTLDRFQEPSLGRNFRERICDAENDRIGGDAEVMCVPPRAASSGLRDPMGNERVPRPSVIFADARNENRQSEQSLGPPPSVYRPSENTTSLEQSAAQVVLVQRDSQIRTFGGCPRDDLPYDEWETETRIVLESLGIRTDSNQSISHVVGALTGDARREVLSSDVGERRDAEGIFNILSSAFGELRHPVDLQRELFSLVQAQNETVQKFGTALKVLWQKTKIAHQNYAIPFNANEAMLNGLFVRGIFQPALRQMAISFERDHPGISFANLRREIMVRSSSVANSSVPEGVTVGGLGNSGVGSNRRFHAAGSFRSDQPHRGQHRFEQGRNRFPPNHDRDRFFSPRSHVNWDRQRFQSQHSRDVGQARGYSRHCPPIDNRPRWGANGGNVGSNHVRSQTGNGRHLSY